MLTAHQTYAASCTRHSPHDGGLVVDQNVPSDRRLIRGDDQALEPLLPQMFGDPLILLDCALRAAAGVRRRHQLHVDASLRDENLL